jgi:hypothetical protein
MGVVKGLGCESVYSGRDVHFTSGIESGKVKALVSFALGY